MTVRKRQQRANPQTRESQRKTAVTASKYVDARGKTRSVYSWTLTTHDLTPKGKKASPCLRALEHEIQRDPLDKVAPNNMTVYELASRYTETKTAVKQSTRAAYKTILNFLATDEFGSRRICGVTSP